MLDLSDKLEAKVAKYIDLAKMWVLGDMLLDPALCNAATDQTLSTLFPTNKQAHGETLHYIWDHTRPDSPLQRLHLDMWTIGTSVTCFLEQRTIGHSKSSSKSRLGIDFLGTNVGRHRSGRIV